MLALTKRPSKHHGPLTQRAFPADAVLAHAALAAGTPIPAVGTNFQFAQLAPGVLAIIRQGDGPYLTAPPVTAASPAAPGECL